MAVVDISVGTNLSGVAASAAVAGHGGELSVLRMTVDFAAHPLVAANQLKLWSLPAGKLPVKTKAKITGASLVAGATIDIGTYASSNDAAIDADCLANEVVITSLGEKVAQAPLAAAGSAVPFWIGICQGAGGGEASFNSGVLELEVTVI